MLARLSLHMSKCHIVGNHIHMSRSNMLKPTVPNGESSTLLQFETNGPAHDGLLLKAYAQTPNTG